ncbi:hypothetical protein COO60DRAFT_452725 [Scenedesmus sp. NREL 46B-D3]|nr:hypothetical protein COO60DRAFT_452725 [Scenedesmus sp. NREL 46B-D3]
MPMDAAAVGACSDSSGVTGGSPDGEASSRSLMQPMVERFAQQLQSASQPQLLRRLGLPADASANDAAGASSIDQDCRKPHSSSSSSSSSRGSNVRYQQLTQAAVDAAAALKAAAAARSAVLPLIKLSSAQLGSGAAHIMPGQQPQRDAPATTHTAKSHRYLGAIGSSSSSSSSSKLVPLSAVRSAAGAAPSAPAGRSASEEALVALSCLAVQGVWSAVGQLWSLTADDPAASSSNRLVGLTRPAAQQQLLAQVLHVAELRLRLQAFLQHFAGKASALQGSSSSAVGAAGVQLGSANAAEEGISDDVSSQPVLQAFLSAVKEVLDMHDAAMQSMHSSGWHSRRPSGLELEGTGQLRKQQQQQQQHWQCLHDDNRAAAAAQSKQMQW